MANSPQSTLLTWSAPPPAPFPFQDMLNNATESPETCAFGADSPRGVLNMMSVVGGKLY